MLPRASSSAAAALWLLVESYETDWGDDSEEWDEMDERIVIETPRTAAALFAGWMLREGWLWSNADFEACEARDRTFDFVGDHLRTTQSARLRGAPRVAAPHWQRARAWREAGAKRAPPPKVGDARSSVRDSRA
ncbi:MAG TPA: hypothetical protein VF331_27045 [Polyangiales bacterium]